MSEHLKNYPENDKDKIVPALFRNKRDDWWVQRDLNIFKKLSSC